jgi:hypothetical protein
MTFTSTTPSNFRRAERPNCRAHPESLDEVKKRSGTFAPLPD